MLKLIDVGKTYRTKAGGLLSSQYRQVTALQHVNLEIPKGQTLTLLGPNGAGKSTLCRIAGGVVKPSSGVALLNGVDVTKNIRQVSQNIGMVMGPALVYNRLTGFSYLKFFAKVYRVADHERRILELTTMLRIDKWLNAYIESYSLGMKMKVSLARALLHDPEFLILDEFTMGLDPAAAAEIRDFVTAIRRTVLMTTHNTLEARKMSDKIAFLSKGRIVILDSVEELLRSIENRTKLVVSVADPLGATKGLAQFDDVAVHQNQKGQLELLSNEQLIPDVLRVLADYKIKSIQSAEPSLDEAYSLFAGETLTQKD